MIFIRANVITFLMPPITPNEQSPATSVLTRSVPHPVAWSVLVVAVAVLLSLVVFGQRSSSSQLATTIQATTTSTSDNTFPCPKALSDNERCTMRLLTDDGGRLDWYRGESHDLIAFDRIVDTDTMNTEVFIMDPDDPDGATCVTCGGAIPEGFVGNPVLSLIHI